MRRLLPLALVFATGCASSAAFRAAENAERLQDYDRAVVEYQRAVSADPDNVQYRRSLERARMRAANDHTNRARRQVGRGSYDEALAEYRLALELYPGAPGVAEEMKDAEAMRDRGKVAFEDLRERTRERALPGLDLGPDAQQPLGLVFRGASLREAYQALARAAAINVTFDPSFQDAPVTLDLQNVGFDQALTALAAAGRTFHRVVDSKVLNVVPDTASKRREFEQQVVKTLFLSNADLKETIDLLRVVLGARRIAPLPGANALTINDTPDKVAAAERIVEIVDKRRAEVVVEVQILEVARNKLKEYGIYLTSGLDGQGIEGIASGVFPDPTITSPSDGPYDRDNLVVTSLPGAVLRLLETDSSTRLLANPQLRTSEGQTAQARFGDQVPVPVTTFTAIATGGLPQQPITSFEYKNVGVNIDVTPRVHQDGEVTLQLKIDISAVGAPGFQGLPTFNSRTVNSTIRLRDGETNMLAGLILDSEQSGLTGIPGLASIPFLGRLFAKNKDEARQTDIVMTLTPHVIRRTDVLERDLRSFLVGGEASPFLFEVPAQAPAPGLPVRPEQPRIEPIRPPAATPPPNR